MVSFFAKLVKENKIILLDDCFPVYYTPRSLTAFL